MKNVNPLSGFRRTSVADQAGRVLRDAITRRSLPDPLPGEHLLARQLGISRGSLRAALEQLGAEGLLTRLNGRRTRLRPHAARRQARNPPTVCVVCPMSRADLIPNEFILKLHAACVARGMIWEEAFDAKLDARRPEKMLRTLVADRTHVCWILLGCAAPIQQWFARARVPTFILGSCQAGITLPSIDFDFHAIGWHAAGLLAKNHHRNIALLQSHRELAGDLETIKGFQEYLAQSALRPVVKRIFVNADLANLRPKLDQLMQSPEPPTAIFCLRPDYALNALVHLLRSGRRIPGEVSLLSRDSHLLLEQALPDLARYLGSSDRHCDRAVRFAESLLAGHEVPPRPILFIPTFIPGSTLGAVAPPAAARPR